MSDPVISPEGFPKKDLCNDYLEIDHEEYKGMTEEVEVLGEEESAEEQRQEKFNPIVANEGNIDFDIEVDGENEQCPSGDEINQLESTAIDAHTDNEEEKNDGQEGLDLEMTEEDNTIFADEVDSENERGAQLTCVKNQEDGPVVMSTAKVEQEQPQQEGDDVEANKNVAEKCNDTTGLLMLPPHGSEVDVDGITKDISEDDLRELCSSCGDIHQIEIIRDKDTGEVKGHGLVVYNNNEHAEKAVEVLNNSEMKGTRLRFSKSLSKHRLSIGNVPQEWEKEDLQKILENQGPGVQNVELHKDPQNPGALAYVDYYNHACAENARRKMTAEGFKMGPNLPTVSWAEPPIIAPDSSTSQVKVVFVRNLPNGATQEQVQKLFEHHGEITKVVLPAPKPGQARRDYGFVHFSESSSALKAVEKNQKYELEGRTLEASLAKPPGERKAADFGHPYQRAGILPAVNQSGLMSGYSSASFYGGVSPYGSRGYVQQPLIYGRGPMPPGMTMVPIILPDGRTGYVMQESGGQGRLAPFRSSGNNRRYRPY